MNVDLEIYINNIIKFFKKNPKDLLSLVPEDKEEELYQKIRERATQNLKEGLEIVLTQKQILEICVDINGGTKKNIEVDSKLFLQTNFGPICLN